VVFPGEYAEPERVIEELPPLATGKRPLFILLDATWTEARKMFRKSPYLNRFPVLSLRPEQLSRYRLRRSKRDEHLCTAEVAALCLELAGEPQAAVALDAWLDLFTEHYLGAKHRRVLDEQSPAHQALKPFL
jgi:DTW domain-containing protein YfiP